MNAAARLVQGRVLTRRLALSVWLSKKQVTLMVLAFLVSISALGSIYVTHVSRILNANFQQQLVEQAHLQVARGQLLLENSTMLLESKTQRIAESQLQMFVPHVKSMIVVHE